MQIEQFNSADLIGLIHAIELYGCALVDGIANRDQMIDFAAQLGSIYIHRDSDSSGLTDLAVSAEKADAPGMGGFSSSPLELHTDRSTLEDPPNIVILRCQQQSELGGELRCVDGRLLFARLAEHAPDVFEWATQHDRIVYFDGERYYNGPIFCRRNDIMSICFRCDGRGYYRKSDSNFLERFLENAAAVETMVKLQPGQTIVLHNRWWLHGRTRFIGSREVWRILVDNPERFGRGFPITPTMIQACREASQ